MSVASHQTVRLGRGKHASPNDGVCVMELSSMLAGEPFSDRPRSVCPVIASLMRILNDTVDDDRRQNLYRYAAAAVGTRASDGVRLRRLQRCREEADAIHAERSLARRLVAGAPLPIGNFPSANELDRYIVQLLRAMCAKGRGGPDRAMALVDELMRIGSDAHAPTPRGRATRDGRRAIA